MALGFFSLENTKIKNRLIAELAKNEAIGRMTMLWSLFFSFFKIGLFGYGGGYAMISLIQNELLSNGWMSKAKFVDIIAIAQMTPGPIAVNSATFIGYELASYKGAFIATLAVLLPSFILVNILAIYIKSVTHSRFTNSILQYLRPVIIALIINAAYTIAKDAIADYFSLIILGFSFFLIWKTKLHPIFIIALSGLCGMIYYGSF